MKRWKQMMPLCMAAAVTMVLPVQSWAGSPEFARTAEEWARLRDNQMEYGELAGLIHEYNATVLNNQLDFNKKKNDGDITSDEIAQAYRDQANDLRSSITGESGMAGVSDAGLEAQARMLEQQADNNVTDLEIYRMNYEKSEANLVIAAQNGLIAYHQKLEQIPVHEKNVETLTAAYHSANAKLSVGTTTQVEVLTAQKNLQDAQAALSQLHADVIKSRQNLCILLGWSYDASPEMGGIPSTDLTRIEAMNPQEDKAKAIENNYTWKVNKRKLDNATAESTRETLRNTIGDNEQKIGSDLVLKHQAVLQLKSSYDQAVSDFNLAAQNMQSADMKLQVGSIARLEHLQTQNTYVAKQAAVKTADLNLFQAIETYDWAINGLAAAE